MSSRSRSFIPSPLIIALVLVVAVAAAAPSFAASFEESRIYIEFNASANDLGFHVSLDGEHWKSLKIMNPQGTTVFETVGRAGYAQLGLTELFFEGAEPSLDDVPLSELLTLFPEGRYRFVGTTVDGGRLNGVGTLSHAVPAGPSVSAVVDDDTVVIRWNAVTSAPDGFPVRRIRVVGYQVIVGSSQVTLPASARQVELPEEFVASLPPGEQAFEVLAIEASGNQTITEGAFEVPD
jgi:hypothetical protein